MLSSFDRQVWRFQRPQQLFDDEQQRYRKRNSINPVCLAVVHISHIFRSSYCGTLAILRFLTRTLQTLTLAPSLHAVRLISFEPSPFWLD